MEITASTSSSAAARTLTWSDGTDSLVITTADFSSSAGNAHAQLDDIRDKLDALTDLKGFSFTFLDASGNVVDSTGGSNWRDTAAVTTNSGTATLAKLIVSRDDNSDFTLVAGGTTGLSASIDGGANSVTVNTGTVTTDVLVKSSVDWVDEKNPPVKVGYDATNQRLSFEVDRTVLGSGTDSNFNSFSVYGSSTQTASTTSA